MKSLSPHEWSQVQIKFHATERTEDEEEGAADASADEDDERAPLSELPLG